MKYSSAVLLALLIATPAIAADNYTIRENIYPGGPPNTLQRGTIVESNGDGSYTARQETLPGVGYGNRQYRGEVVTPQDDGSYRVQREMLPGTGVADPMDSGYTISRD